MEGCHARATRKRYLDGVGLHTPPPPSPLSKMHVKFLIASQKLLILQILESCLLAYHNFVLYFWKQHFLVWRCFRHIINVDFTRSLLVTRMLRYIEWETICLLARTYLFRFFLYRNPLLLENLSHNLLVRTYLWILRLLKTCVIIFPLLFELRLSIDEYFFFIFFLFLVSL